MISRICIAKLSNAKRDKSNLFLSFHQSVKTIADYGEEAVVGSN